jgi:hypothetical protein
MRFAPKDEGSSPGCVVRDDSLNAWDSAEVEDQDALR